MHKEEQDNNQNKINQIQGIKENQQQHVDKIKLSIVSILDQIGKKEIVRDEWIEFTSNIK